MYDFVVAAGGSWLCIYGILAFIFRPSEEEKDRQNALMVWSVLLALAFGLWVAPSSSHVPLSYHSPHVSLRYHSNCEEESDDNDDHPEYDDPGFGLHP